MRKPMEKLEMNLTRGAKNNKNNTHTYINQKRKVKESIHTH